MVIAKTKRVKMAALLFIALVVSFYFIHQMKSPSFFEETLASAVFSEHFTIENNTYVIRNGTVYTGTNLVKDREVSSRVLRLGWYLKAHQVQPLFSIGGADTEKTVRTVGALKKLLEEFPQLFGEDEELLKEHSYPVAFLEQLVALEKTRRDVMNRPSDEAVSVYQKELEKTANLYLESIDGLIKTYTGLQKKAGIFTVMFYGGGSDYQHFIDMAVLVKRGAEKTLEEIRNRKACYEGEIPHCTSIKKYKEAVRDSLNETYPPDRADRISILEEEKIGMIKTIVASFFLSKPENSGGNPPAPLIKLSGDRCFPYVERPVYFLWWSEREDGLQAMKSILVNDLYFQDASLADKNSYLGEIYEATGLRYINQITGNYYLCPIGDRTALRLGTLYRLYAELLKQPITLGYYGPDAKLRNLAILEKKITTSTNLLDESDVAEYIKILAQVISEHSENELEERLNGTAIQSAQRILNVAYEQTGELERVLANAAELNKTNASFQKIFGSLTVHSLMLTRSYPSLLYQTYNKSVTRSAGDPFTSSVEIAPAEAFHLVSYIRDLRNEYSAQEIKGFIEESDRLQNNILRSRTVSELGSMYR